MALIRIITKHYLHAGLIFIPIGMLVLLQQCARDDKYIAPDTGKIVVTGRHNITSEGWIVYDYPAVSLRLRFRGTTIGLHIADTSNYFNVFIDKRLHQVFKGTGDKHYVLAENLRDTIHTVNIIKRTEAEVGKTVVKGVVLPADAALFKAFSKPHKIEVIGNSITCGYGAEALAGANYSDSTEDARDSYAAFLADTFNADLSMVAYSGKGVVRNYGDSVQVSRVPMPALYNRALVFQADAEWDFSQWIPDLVMINLGTNDFSTRPHPDSAMFVRAYKRLMAEVHKHYPDVPLFTISGPLMNAPASRYIRAAGTSYRQSHNARIRFVELPSDLLIEPDDYGADHHPAKSGQKKMADYIYPHLKAFMQW